MFIARCKILSFFNLTLVQNRESHKKEKISNKRGLLVLSPLIVFIGLYLGISLASGDFYGVPISALFLIACIYAIIVCGGLPLARRMETFSRGAGSQNMMLMLWIFMLAGAFAHSAKEMGCIDATVNLTLHLLSDGWLLAGLFVAACFISLSIGTSVGTIVALTPIAVGLADATNASVPLITAVVVGGAFFGDNLSFISDTTIVATTTQGCKMNDKFKTNLRIVLPAAIIVFILYAFKGANIQSPTQLTDIQFIRIIPYLAVLVVALAGMNVMAVLTIGLALTGIIGISLGAFNLFGWLASIGAGIQDMGELIIVTLLAGGLLEIVRSQGGIDYVIEKLTAHVHGKRGAEMSIGMLVALVDVCTANNTVAIITVGDIAKQIGDRYGVDKRKCASILDTFSCSVQGLLPYGAQLLAAASLASITPFELIPYLYYPVAIGIAAIISILIK